MDFGFDADQQSLQVLAKKALADGRGAAVWEELGRAGLLGLAIPVEHDGAGLGFVEQCLLFEQAGRAAAPPSLVPTGIAGAALARFGTGEQAQRWLGGVAVGTTVVTLALHEPGGEPTRPAVRAERDAGGWRLDGVKLAVPALDRAALVIVPARLADGQSGMFLVPADAPGLRRETAVATDDTTVHHLTLERVVVDGAAALARDQADAALAWVLRRVTVGFCAFELGIAQRQLEMTAEYVVRRQQFGKPLGLFQAVGQRCADMHIDVESLRLATWQAAFHIVRGDEAQRRAEEAAVATAAWWAAEAGARVAVAAQHLHGGIGFDRSYPLYRYFLAAKRIELEVGGASRQLARLGRLLTTEVQS